MRWHFPVMTAGYSQPHSWQPSSDVVSVSTAALNLMFVRHTDTACKGVNPDPRGCHTAQSLTHTEMAPEEAHVFLDLCEPSTHMVPGSECTSVPLAPMLSQVLCTTRHIAVSSYVGPSGPFPGCMPVPVHDCHRLRAETRTE